MCHFNVALLLSSELWVWFDSYRCLGLLQQESEQCAEVAAAGGDETEACGNHNNDRRQPRVQTRGRSSGYGSGIITVVFCIFRVGAQAPA